MKKLGAYVGDSWNDVEKNTFVWYEVVRSFIPRIGDGEDVYVCEVFIWSLKSGYPNGRKPDAKFNTTNKHLIEHTIIPMKEVADRYCIEWENQQWQIKGCEVRYDYHDNYEYVSTLKLDQFGSNNYCHWDWEGERALSVLKTATVNRIHEPEGFRTVKVPVMPVTIKEELKKSLEQAVMNDALIMSSAYRMYGSFTTNPDPFKVVKIAEKETKTMEKKKMTVTDLFLKDIDSITITSTYTKLDLGCGKPYYIYYPEMEITEDIADILLTVLLMAKKDFIHKVVFNPEKGTTMLYRDFDKNMITVRCRDGEFDYILGYNMARSKMYIGTDDYNWFNKIKNHRKTHIEYTEKPTEPKAKRTSKKGGKK